LSSCFGLLLTTIFSLSCLPKIPNNTPFTFPSLHVYYILIKIDMCVMAF
jgi:hypothetical protein